MLGCHPLWPLIIGGGMLVAFINHRFFDLPLAPQMLVCCLMMLFPLMSTLYEKKVEVGVAKLKNFLLIITYTTLPINLLLLLPFAFKAYDYRIVLALFILLWSNDSFAYLFGKFFGRAKLLPHISPKKTVFGFVMGFICAIFTGVLLPFLCDEITYEKGMVLGAIVGITAPIGDLIISMLKRQSNRKDTGCLIPGHGGFLDRFDSLFIAVPSYYYFIINFVA